MGQSGSVSRVAVTDAAADLLRKLYKVNGPLMFRQPGPNHGGPGGHIANAGFMVDPAYGGRGAGRALVLRVNEAAAADGYRGIQFNAVAATNTHAVRLYIDCGYEIVATIPEGFHHPTEGYVGKHIMYRPLP